MTTRGGTRSDEVEARCDQRFRHSRIASSPGTLNRAFWMNPFAAECADPVAVVRGVPGGHEHDDRWHRGVEEGIDDGESVRVRKDDVEEHDVGAQLLRREQAGCRIAGFADDGERTLLEQHAGSITEASMVIDDEDAAHHEPILNGRASGVSPGYPQYGRSRPRACPDGGRCSVGDRRGERRMWAINAYAAAEVQESP